MVCVSGSKVRSLREKQELTQLYLATAVEVTTETISRWERAESPTLKKENGLKLAEALGVSLDDISFAKECVIEEKEIPDPASVPVAKNGLWLVTLLLPLVLLFVYYSKSGNVTADFSVQRLLPTHSVAGYPFPVVIKVDPGSLQNSSLLLKEQLPTGCRVLQTIPEATTVSGNLLKWVDKNGSGERFFAYLAICEPGTDNNQQFSGVLLSRQSSRQEFPVNGQNRIRLESFHWADANRDNVIDDEELLGVYDDYGQVEGLQVDVEEIESIWMGSGYRWLEDTKAFEIIP